MFSGICVLGQANAEAKARAQARKKDTKGFLVFDCRESWTRNLRWKRLRETRESICQMKVEKREEDFTESCVFISMACPSFLLPSLERRASRRDGRDPKNFHLRLNE